MGSWQRAGTNEFLGNGDVMIHRPYLVALVCGERVAKPTPASSSPSRRRSNKT
jgi:hypothetical protein